MTHRIGLGAAVLAVLMTVAMTACVSPEVLATRKLVIAPIDLQQARDGTYLGQHTYGEFTYEVEVTVLDHRIEDIVVLSNRDTPHAIKAEGVIQAILEEQRNDVDAVSGATTTSKALLKAVEEALLKSLE